MHVKDGDTRNRISWDLYITETLHSDGMKLEKHQCFSNGYSATWASQRALMCQPTLPSGCNQFMPQDRQPLCPFWPAQEHWFSLNFCLILNKPTVLNAFYIIMYPGVCVCVYVADVCVNYIGVYMGGWKKMKQTTTDQKSPQLCALSSNIFCSVSIF